jgi:hypothetical protein
MGTEIKKYVIKYLIMFYRLEKNIAKNSICFKFNQSGMDS